MPTSAEVKVPEAAVVQVGPSGEVSICSRPVEALPPSPQVADGSTAKSETSTALRQASPRRTSARTRSSGHRCRRRSCCPSPWPGSGRRRLGRATRRLVVRAVEVRHGCAAAGGGPVAHELEVAHRALCCTRDRRRRSGRSPAPIAASLGYCRPAPADACSCRRRR